MLSLVVHWAMKIVSIAEKIHDKRQVMDIFFNTLSLSLSQSTHNENGDIFNVQCKYSNSKVDLERHLHVRSELRSVQCD